MLSHKDALLFLGLMMTLGCVSCAALQPRARERRSTQPVARSHEDRQPAAPLRITAPPTQPSLATRTNPADGAPGRETSPNQFTSLPQDIGDAAPKPADDAAENLRRLHRQAAERYAGIEAYNVRLKRREQIGGKNNPEELIFFQFRKQPWSVYFKWLGPAGQGREVVYVKGHYENKIHIKLSADDNKLLAGKHMAFALDNPTVLKNSRHPITEAGFGFLIDRFGLLVDANDKGDRRLGTVRYVGSVTRPEYETPLEGVEQIIAPGAEPQLPRGGRRLWLFDPKERLPMFLLTQDERGQEVEYYCHDRFQAPVKLDDDDFNPDRLWSGKR